MAEHTTGEGGAANMPPFPRLVPHDPLESSPSQPDISPAASHATDSEQPQASTRGAAANIDPEELDTIETPLDPDEMPLPEPTRRPRSGSPTRGEIRRYAERSVARGCKRLADQLDDAAERIARIARNRPVAGAAESVDPLPPIGWMADAADYLRSSDLPTMQSDLARRTRARPFQTIFLALGAGWVLGRILR